jgi:hypothetical protein
MLCRSVLLLVLAPAAHAAVLRGKTETLDANAMRPEVVAATLAHVEDDWKAEAAVFTMECNSTDGNTDCKGAPGAFGKSCATVVAAVVQGSGGDRVVAREYMTNVCGQNALSGWHKQRCSDLADAIIQHGMTADNYANRESLDAGKLCNGFWSKFVEAERKREAEEAAERAEREKKEAEEAAEAKAKAEADAKAEAERRAKEEEQRQEEEKQEASKKEAVEAKVRAAEAKAKAAEAAAKLAEKRAEAEKVQKAAQQKLEEAQQAEAEHQKLQEEHLHAEEVLRNTTGEEAHNATEEAQPVATVNATVQEAAPASTTAVPAEAVNATEKENATEAAPVEKKA